MSKPRIATATLAGCFGCHMSLLDVDERLLDLIELVDFDLSPIVDLKDFSRRCKIGLIEGGCGNAADVERLCRFREMCALLVAVGDCAITGGVPAMRNMIPLEECMRTAYETGPSVYNPEGRIPLDDELPPLLDSVVPVPEVVRIDYFVPGCPPSAQAFWEVLTALLDGSPPQLPYSLLKYD